MPCNLVVRACCAMVAQSLLSACTVSPIPGGGYQISTPSVISLLSHSDQDGVDSAAGSPVAGEPAPGGPVAKTQADRGQPTSYAGVQDGGKGTATLTPIDGNEYRLSLQVGAHREDRAHHRCAARSPLSHIARCQRPLPARGCRRPARLRRTARRISQPETQTARRNDRMARHPLRPPRRRNPEPRGRCRRARAAMVPQAKSRSQDQAKDKN